MSFVVAFTALMTSFVLIAPIAMAVMLVKGPARLRVAAPATARATTSHAEGAASPAGARHLASAA